MYFKKSKLLIVLIVYIHIKNGIFLMSSLVENEDSAIKEKNSETKRRDLFRDMREAR